MGRLKRPWTFTRRIAVGLIASLVVALAITTSTALALRAVLTSNEQVSLSHLMHLVEVERLRRAFSDKVASQQGHELTGDASLLVDEQQARTQFENSLRLLRSHEEGERERGLLDGLVQAEQAHEDATRRLREARARGVSPREMEVYRQRVEQARHHTYEALDWLAWYTGETFRQQAQQARLSGGRVLWLILAAALLGLLVAMGLAWVLARALWPLHHEARATEERFRLLVEGVKDYALYLLDPQGRVASWNAGAERLQGWKAGEIIGRPGALLYPPKEMKEGLPGWELELAAREGRLESEGSRLRKDGSRFWAESLLTALRGVDGRLEGYVVLTRDITERSRMERAQHLFAEAERLFHSAEDPDQAVVELARLLVPELADGCILSLINAAGEAELRALIHISKEKERLIWENVHSPRKWKDGPHSAWEVMRTGKSELVTEVTPELMREAAADDEDLLYLQRLGTLSYLMVPLRTGGRTLGVLLLMSQRPERRFTETDRVFIEELVSRAALALDNARLLREAQAALELIGVAAHDLGNPLQALQLMLGKLRRAPPSEPDKLREVLTMAMRHTQRLGRLLHNLLDLSRLSSGMLDLEVGEVDLAELAYEAVTRHAEQAMEVGSRLVLDVELGVVGRWDRLRLERVVTNLLSNAFKYGKGRPIEVRVERTAGFGRLVVRDHGPGIAPEQQRSIFERFKKAPARGEKKEGFGLGLYIVRQLVEAHGGTVRVDSTPGEGATFTVELPLVEVRREVDGAIPPPAGLVH